MDNMWWALNREKKLGESQNRTSQFINELESILSDFENKNDIKELSSKIKESIDSFKKEVQQS